MQCSTLLLALVVGLRVREGSCSLVSGKQYLIPPPLKNITSVPYVTFTDPVYIINETLSCKYITIVPYVTFTDPVYIINDTVSCKCITSVLYVTFTDPVYIINDTVFCKYITTDPVYILNDTMSSTVL